PPYSLPAARPPPPTTYPLSLHDALPIFDAAHPRRDQRVRHRVEIGHDVAFDPRLERALPVERQVKLLARFGHQRQAKQRSAPAIDRKSTRLNSSHVAISYAVFCLKKKSR